MDLYATKWFTFCVYPQKYQFMGEATFFTKDHLPAPSRFCVYVHEFATANHWVNVDYRLLHDNDAKIK